MVDFIYPFFQNSTHKISEDNVINFIDYPLKNKINRDYSLSKDLEVCVIREGLGWNSKFSFVKITDENSALYGNEIYIKSEKLVGILDKKSMKVFSTPKNRPDPEAEEIVDSLVEPFIPYVDARNGLYSVKIEMEYEKFLDNVVLMNSIIKAHRQGIRTILESRGLRSDDGYIDELINNYYTFAYVNKTPDILNVRPCVPVRFTISVPLVFINNLQEEIEDENIVDPRPEYTIEFNTSNFSKISEKIMNAFLARSTEIDELLRPLKFLENFMLSYELSSVAKFVTVFQEMLEKANKLPDKDEFNEYEINLTKDLDIISIFIYSKAGKYKIPKSIIKQFEFSKDTFGNKRLLNYYINYMGLEADSINENIDVLDFIYKNVKYPTPNLKQTIEIIPGSSITNTKAKEYLDLFRSQEEGCYTVGSLNDIMMSDPLYHLFVSSTQKNQETSDKNVFQKLDEIFSIMESVDPSAKDTEDEANPYNFNAWDSIKSVGSRTIGNETGSLSIPPSLTPKGKKIASWRRASIACLSILERVNFAKIIFQYLICQLMNGDPNDKKYAELLEKYLTPEILGFIIHMLADTEDSKDLLFKAAKKLPINLELFCVRNKAVAYFLRGLLAGEIKFGDFKIPLNFKNGSFDITRPMKAKIEEIKKTRRSRTEKQFYVKMLGDIFNNVMGIIMRRLMDYLKLFLEEPCKLDQFTDNSSQNILNTDLPKSGFNNTITNLLDTSDANNPRNIDAARATIPIRYNTDPEGAINLLSKFMEDLSCVLTPLEICDALDENISAEVLLLIKGIVRRNYLPDLEEMLSESSIMSFFTLLSTRVDPEVCKHIKNSAMDTIRNIADTLSTDPNVLNAISIKCDPIINKNRENILNNKGDNPLIDQKTQQRNKVNDNIKKLFDNGFDRPIDVSFFCDPSGESIIPDLSFRDYRDQVLASFREKFNDEALSATANFIENKKRMVKDKDGNIKSVLQISAPYDSYKYNCIFMDPTGIEVNNNFLTKANISTRLSSDFTDADMLELYKSIGSATVSMPALPDSCNEEQQTLSLQDLSKLLRKIPVLIEMRDAPLDETIVGSYDRLFDPSEKPNDNPSTDFDKNVYTKNWWDLEDVQALRLRNLYPFVILISYNETFMGDDEVEFMLCYNDRKSQYLKKVSLGTTIKPRKNSDTYRCYGYMRDRRDEFDSLDALDDAENNDEEQHTKIRALNAWKVWYYTNTPVPSEHIDYLLNNVDEIYDNWSTGGSNYSPTGNDIEIKKETIKGYTANDYLVNSKASHRDPPINGDWGVGFEFAAISDFGIGSTYTYFKNTDDFQAFLNKHPNIYSPFIEAYVTFMSKKEFKDIIALQKLEDSLSFLRKLNNFKNFESNLLIDNNKNLSIFDKAIIPVILGDGNGNVNIQNQEINYPLKNNREIKLKNKFIEADLSKIPVLIRQYFLNKPTDTVSTSNNITIKKLDQINMNKITNIFSALLQNSICSNFDMTNGFIQKESAIKINQETTTVFSQEDESNKDVISQNKSLINYMNKNGKYVAEINTIRLALYQSLKQETCQVFPHYFNDTVWTKEFDKNLKAKLCDGDPAAFPEEMLKIIFKLILRVFVAEIMMRGMHKFIVYKTYDIEKILTDVDFKTIIREAFLRELDEYSVDITSSFLEILKHFYKQDEENGALDNGLSKLDEKYIENIELDNKEINYYLTKEIIYFFTILNKIISDLPDNVKTYREFKDNLKKASRYFDYSDIPDIQSLENFRNNGNICIFSPPNLQNVEEIHSLRYQMIFRSEKGDNKFFTWLPDTQEFLKRNEDWDENDSTDIGQLLADIKNTLENKKIGKDIEFIRLFTDSGGETFHPKNYSEALADADKIRNDVGLKYNGNMIDRNDWSAYIPDEVSDAYIEEVLDKAKEHAGDEISYYGTYALHIKYYKRDKHFLTYIRPNSDNESESLIINQINSSKEDIVRSINEDKTTNEFLDKLGIKEANLLGLHYIMNYFNTDKKTRNNFIGIKTDLKNMFLKLAKLTTNNATVGTPLADMDSIIEKLSKEMADRELPRDKLKMYLSQMAASNDPEGFYRNNKTLASTGAEKLWQTVLASTLHMVKTSIESNDLMAWAAKNIISLLTGVFKFGWEAKSSSEESRIRDIQNAPWELGYTLTRVKEGRPFIYEAVGLAPAFLLANPTWATWIWAGTSIGEEFLEDPKTWASYKKYRDIKFAEEEPCTTRDNLEIMNKDSVVCTVDGRKKLLDELEDLENNTVKYLENI